MNRIRWVLLTVLILVSCTSQPGEVLDIDEIATQTAAAQPTPTASYTPLPPTLTTTPSPTPTSTPTATLTLTATPTFTPTLTPTPTLTRTPTMTATTPPNQPPVIYSPGDVRCDPGEALDLVVAHSDPDGDPVRVVPVFSNEAVARADMVDLHTVHLTCLSEGTSIITLTVDDGRGGAANVSFTVTIRGVRPAGADYIIYNDETETVLALVNAARAEVGAGPLTLNAQLSQAALNHTVDMVMNDFVSHTGSDGGSVGDRADAAGYRWLVIGENIAAGTRTAEEAFEGWKESPGHWENILRAEFTEMGLAFVYRAGTDYEYYWTQTFGHPR